MAGSTGRNVLHITLLSCSCTRSFAIRPNPRDEVYCPRCNKTVRVVNAQSAMWKIKCQDCRYAANFGAAPLTAHVKASSHAIRKHHVVEVIDSEGWAELVGNLGPSQMILF